MEINYCKLVFIVNQLIVGELVCSLSSMLTVVVVVSDGVIANLFCEVIIEIYCIHSFKNNREDTSSDMFWQYRTCEMIWLLNESD